jgi:hypothetical protein
MSDARDPRFAELDRLVLNQEIRDLSDPSSRVGRAWRPEERAQRLRRLLAERNRRAARAFRAKRRKDQRERSWWARRAAYLVRGERWEDLRREGFR